MWIIRFKHKLKELGLTYQDASDVMGMKKNGFASAIKNETFSFRNMLKIADAYKFSLDELRYEGNNVKVEEANEKYQLLQKKHTFEGEKTLPHFIYEDAKKNYESRIEDLKTQITDLKGQVQYLKNLLEKKK